MRRFENSLRKILAGILLLAIAVPAEAVTNAVSQPAGFIRVNLDANSDTLLSTPFDAFGPDINSIFFGQLTGETNQDSADVIRVLTTS